MKKTARLASESSASLARSMAGCCLVVGRGMMAELIEALNAWGAAPGCPELATLGRTLKRRMPDILAFFDWEHSANGPTEAINGRLETLMGIALGFRNLDNYITRSLLHTGGFRHTIQTHL